MRHTNEQIAKSWDLWGEYVDPLMAFSYEEFLELSHAKKIEIMREVRKLNSIPSLWAEGPTDEEIMELMPQQMRDDLDAAAESMACALAFTGIGPDSPKAAGVCRLILNRHAIDHVRAALAKWGHQ